MKIHELKSWPEFFEPIASGQNAFELRINDRDFQVGDILRLREYDERNHVYTGREMHKRITFLIDGVGPGAITPLKGLLRGYVILSLVDYAVDRETV